MLSGRRIILGVTGSIAAYKSAYLARLLMKAGAEVRVVMTESAERFITPLTFFHLTGKPVFSRLWEGEWTEHVHTGRWAELFLIAPATAGSMAKLVSGACDNALTAVFLSANCPVLIAPAMDADMFQHPAVQENLEKLRARGYEIIEGDEGPHASGLTGPGRMAEPEAILQKVIEMFSRGPLSGKKVLITAGPTREPIDPVRFLSNHSSGKMGIALAEAARKAGASVSLVLGPVALPPPSGCKVIPVETAEQMANAAFEEAKDADILILAAAVADYTPAAPASQKIKKQEGAFSLELKKTTDILQTLGQNKKPNQYLAGFALETENGIENARIKLQKKNLDLIVLNLQGEAGAGFGTDTNRVTFLDSKAGERELPLLSKAETATEIIRKIISDTTGA